MKDKVSESIDLCNPALRAINNLDDEFMPRGMRDDDASEPGQVWVSELSINEIRTARDNDKLYKPIDSADPDIKALAASIRKYGVLEPLVVTADGFLISGHRRLVAARIAGLKVVPVLLQPILYSQHRARFIELLRECNRQRVKTHAEKLREVLVSATRDDAYKALIEARHTREPSCALCELDLGPTVRRDAISKAKYPLLDAIEKVIDSRKQFWPLSDRQVHYALLNDPPLRHARKPGSVYANDKKSYRDLTDVLTRARLTKLIPMESIHDPTRPVMTWRLHRDVQAFFATELDQMLADYHRDLLQTQPHHVELVVEKLSVEPIVRDIALKFGVPFTVTRGYCSLPPRHAIATRFKRSGKGKLVLLVASDFDPDGEEIAASLGRSLRDDFHIDDPVVNKVALTADQVSTMDLAANQLEAKKSSRNYEKFVAKTGSSVAYELEALPPDQLRQLVTHALDSVIDRRLFNTELEQEKQDAAYVLGVRNSMQRLLNELLNPPAGE